MGPAEVTWRALSNSVKANHKNVDIVTHSGWNNTHEHAGTHNLADIQRVFKTVKVIKIPDQNANLRTHISQWYWARDSENEHMRFIYARILAEGKRNSNGIVADVSDAGLAMYVLTGNKYASPSVVRLVIQDK
jgi:hypothetical protein